MDEAAFDAVYAASFSRVVGQVHALCGSMSEAQDCTQEAFVRAWDKRRQLDESESPEAWVRTVALRLAVSRWRKARRGFRRPDRALEEHVVQQPSPTRVALQQALAKLPEEQRRVIVLHHLCDMGVNEIAAEVGVPVGTVKARLSRGRAALVRILGDPDTARD